jgi:hypothetical protein
MFFFQITGVSAFFSSDFRSTSSNFSCRALRAPGCGRLSSTGKTALEPHAWLAERKGDADPFRLAFLDIVEPVFQGTIEVGEYLEWLT